MLNGNVYDLYHNRLEEMDIVFRRIKINLWNVGRERMYTLGGKAAASDSEQKTSVWQQGGRWLQ